MKKSVFAPVFLLATATPLPVFAAESLSVSVSLQTLMITGFFLAPVMLATFISRQQPAMPVPQMTVAVSHYEECDSDVFGFGAEDEAMSTQPEARVAQPVNAANELQGAVLNPVEVSSRHKGLKAA